MSAKVCNASRLAACAFAPSFSFLLRRISEGRATVAAIDQHTANLFQIARAPRHRLQGRRLDPSHRRLLPRLHVKILHIRRDAPLDPQNLLARVVTLFSRAERVLHALRINDRLLVLALRPCLARAAPT
jgi:hypothetical protein